MPPTLDVFVVGDEADLSSDFTEDEWPVSLRLIPAGVPTIAEFAKSPIASKLAEGEADLAAIIVGQDREALRSVAQTAIVLNEARDRAASVMIEQIDDAGSAIDPTQSFLATMGIRILLGPRAGHGPIVFRRNMFKQIGPLRPVTEPVWDWIIRAARAGQKINSSPISVGLKSKACRLPLLVPPRPRSDANWLREHLTDFAVTEFHPGGAAPAKIDEIALRAGLFQWHDFLDESHELSQSIEGQGENQLGDYWHAIMHRREPDFSNAKYWFRQIGNQPIYRDLRQQADGILANSSAADAPRWRARLQSGSKWDPFAFVDLCEKCAADETTELAHAARRIQYAEMSMLA